MMWDEGLETGIEHVDQQHQKIMRAVDLLSSASYDRVTCRVLIDFCFDYMAEHFVDEEQIMEASNFPEIAAHRRLHIQGFDRFVNLRALFLNGKVSPEHIADAFQGWLENHILVEDRKIAAHIQGTKNV